MSDFNQKVASIQSSIDSLIKSLHSVDTALEQTSTQFDEMSQRAENINAVVTSVSRLERLIDKLDKGPFADKLRDQIAAISNEIGQLDLTKMEQLTNTLQGQTESLKLVNSAQININGNLRRARDIIKDLESNLVTLNSAAANVGTDLEGSIQRINESVQNIAPHLDTVKQFTKSLNALQPDKYQQTAQALSVIASVVSQLQAIDLNINVNDPQIKPAAAVIPTLPTHTAAVAPTIPKSEPVATVPRTRISTAARRYAEEHNIDIDQLTKSGGSISINDLRRLNTKKSAVVDQSSLADQVPPPPIMQNKQQIAEHNASVQAIDAALDQLARKKRQIFDQITKEYGYKSSIQRGTAENILMHDDLAPHEKHSALRESRDLKDFGLAEADFNAVLAKSNVETNIPGFENVRTSDKKAIEALKTMREELNARIQELSNALEDQANEAPELSINPTVTTNIRALVNKLRTDKEGTSLDYILSKLIGDKDSFTGGTGIVNESLIHHDPRSQTYSTRGNKIVGANDTEYEVNKAAIERAVRDSANKMAVIGSTGANLGGASLFTGDKRLSGIDHIALAFMDPESGRIRIREKNASIRGLSPGNKLNIPGLGNNQAPERSLEDFASNVDRLHAVSINTAKDVAERFRKNFIEETDASSARPYSFKKSTDALVEAGDTCATVFTRVAEKAGLLLVHSKLEDAGGVLGTKLGENFNLVTPHDVIESVQKYNNFSIPTQNEQRSDLTQNLIEHAGTVQSKLTSSLDTIIAQIKQSFSRIKESISGINLGDIFEYIKSLFKSGVDHQQSNKPAEPLAYTGVTNGLLAPELSIEYPKEALDTFSRQVYSPISYGVTQFGALLNSAREIGKGLQVGGVGGALDIGGGLIKGLHTVANINARYGLNMLPRGVGEVFNKKRSETLMDLYEATVGIIGGGRSPTTRRLRTLEAQEGPLAERKAELQESIASGKLDRAAYDKARAELIDVTEELRQLRSSISAYRRVLADLANQNVKNATSESVNRNLDPEALIGPVAGSTNYFQQTTNRVEQYLNAQDKLISKQAREALQRFSSGTGLDYTSGNVSVIPKNKVQSVYEEFHTKDQLKALGTTIADIRGMALPVQMNQNKIGSHIAVVRGSTDQASTIVHEATHALVTNADIHGARLLERNMSGGLSFGDDSLEKARLQRLRSFDINRSARAREAAIANTTLSNDSRYMTTGAVEDKKLRNYYLNPSEMFAHVGQAKISGDKDLEKALRTIYGDNLFSSVEKELAAKIPEVFGTTALNKLRSAFATFDAEINQITNQPANTTATALNSLQAQVPSAAQPNATMNGISTSSSNNAQVSSQHMAASMAHAGLSFSQGVAQVGIDSMKSMNLDFDINPILVEFGKAFSDEFGGNFHQVIKNVRQVFADIPNYADKLAQTLNPTSPGFSRLATNATELYLPKGTPSRTLYDSAIGSNGGEKLTAALITAIQEPTRESFRELFKSAKQVNIEEIVELYIGKIFTEEGLDLKGGLLAATLFRNGKNTPLPELVGKFSTQFIQKDVNFRDELNSVVRGKTGKNIQLGSFSQQSVFDTETGVEKFTLSARTASGAMISLNAHVDEFGKKIIEEPKGITQITELIGEFVRSIPRELGSQFTYGIVNSIQEMLRQLISVQDELAEVANLLNVVGDEATDAKSKFLFRSVGTATETGQGFAEAIQTNLKNFKILGSLKDPAHRENLANRISSIQLGAQTAFGMSLEQSLESIPSILATIKDGMVGIEDPAEKVSKSIDQLRDIMDQVVIAQRATGAQGEELITVYSRLSESAKEYGLSSKQLLGITATSSVAIGRGSEETSNILRALLEGTYSEANQSSFAKNNITTKSFNTATNTFENRSFEDVLGDLYKLSQDSSRKIQYNQLLQSIAGPKLKPDIAKIVSGFGKNYSTVESQIDSTKEGTFSTLVTQKSQNLQGSLNKLEATGTQLFGSLLVGTGIMDKITVLFDRLSESAQNLTVFLNNNQQSIKSFVDGLLPIIKLFTIGQFTKGANIFAPLAKGINTVETAFEETKAKIIDFGAVGEGASTGITRNLKLVVAVLKEMQEVSLRVGGTLAVEFNKAAGSVDRFNSSIKAGNQPAANASVISTNPELNISPSSTPSINTQLNEHLATISNTIENSVNPKPSLLQKTRQFLQKPGAIGGALAAPIGFDLLSGGITKSNVVNTAGAGIAGAFAGAIAGPQGAIIGYMLAKGFLDNIDFSKFFGVSETESNNFVKALSESLRLAINEQPGHSSATDDPEKEKRTKESELAIQNFGKLDQILGIRNFDKNYTRFYNAQQDQVNSMGLGKLIPGAGLNAEQYLPVSSEDLKRYRRLVVDKSAPEGISDNLFLSDLNGNKRDRAGQVYEALGNNKLRKIYEESNLTDSRKFLQLLSDLSQGKGDLVGNTSIQEILSQLSKDNSTDSIAGTGDTLRASLETSNDIIKRINDSLTEFGANAARLKDIPLGITQYGEFGSKISELDARFAPKFDAIQSGKITGKDAEFIMNQYDKSRASYTAMPGTLQQVIPLAQDLGLNTRGLEQRLYSIGAEGQGELVQRFSQAQSSNQFVREYENKQKALKSYESSDQYKAKDEIILREHDALQKALTADKARYLVNKQYLDIIKSQTNVLLDQTNAIEKQTKTRQLISAGTPAQFQSPSILNTQGYTADQFNKAIASALRKQNALEKLSPGYRKQFAEEQFLLQSGNSFKGITGVNQQFLQEALQSQQSQLKPPALEDLSQYSDVELQKILSRARDLQGQAIKLNPDMEHNYDNERLLIFRKNNQLLQQTGLSQEYLRLAIQENTKSNETLRGHYNLPSTYRTPTVWDYYDQGGKETGNVNFPNKLGSGTTVPLEFAQQLAQEILKGNTSDKGGANLEDITTARGPGAPNSVQYYKGGTPAVYSEPEPLLQALPDTINHTPLPTSRDEVSEYKHAMAVDKRRKDFDAYHAYHLNDYNNVENARSVDAVTKPKPNSSNEPIFGKARAQIYTEQHGYDDIELKRLGDNSQEVSSSLGILDSALRTSSGTAQNQIKGLGTTADTIGGSIKNIISSFTLPTSSMTSNAVTLTTAIASFALKIQQFDLVKLMKTANIVLNVVVNGQAVNPGQATLAVNNTSGGGGKALSAGPVAKTRIS